MRSLLILAAVFAPMLVEAWRAASNEAFQRARGGVEPPGDVYKMMRVAYPFAFLTMIGEGAVRGGAPAAATLTGIAVFAAAKALKWWAVLVLGRSWTFRVIVVPGMRLVASGPYRFLRHPNYVGVIGELAGVALMAGALFTGPLATIGFGVLLLKRIHVEEDAIRALTLTPASPSPDSV